MQITHDGDFYNYISPGKVGKQLDSNSQDYASLFPFNITGLTLDPYGNLYYIYCDASYGNYYVNAVSPNSYTTNIIYSHKIISNTLTPYTSVFAYSRSTRFIILLWKSAIYFTFGRHKLYIIR